MNTKSIVALKQLSINDKGFLKILASKNLVLHETLLNQNKIWNNDKQEYTPYQICIKSSSNFQNGCTLH